MKGFSFSSKHIALKADVIGQENILFAGVSVHHSARKFLQAGAVKGLSTIDRGHPMNTGWPLCVRLCAHPA